MNMLKCVYVCTNIYICFYIRVYKNGQTETEKDGDTDIDR